MAETDLIVYSYDEPKTAGELLGREDIKVRDYKRLLFKHNFATFVYPDELYCEEDDSITTNTLPESYQELDFFKGFSYHVIKFIFGINPKDWSRLESVTLFLNIGHTKEPTVKIHMPAIFPLDEAIPIGETLNQYQLRKNFSIKTPHLQVPGFGFEIPVSAGIDASSEELKKINYGLKIPKVTSATSGNNEAFWTYYHGGAIEPYAQYRADMIVGLPTSKPKRYNVKMTLNTKIKHAFEPRFIENIIPLKFKDDV